MSEPKQPNSEEAMEHLALVRALSARNLVGNFRDRAQRHGGFRARIAAQEAICRKLDRRARKPSAGLCVLPGSIGKSRASIDLARKFGKRISRSGPIESNLLQGLFSVPRNPLELITGLYREPRAALQQRSTPRPSKHTWSCEA